VIASVMDRCDLWARQMHPGLSWMTQGRFTERLPLVDAWTWLDACPDVTGSEAAPLHQAFGRVLRASLTFPADRPERDLALVDGHAVQAASTLGASTYNPLFLTIVPKAMALTAGCASVCHAGETLPSGADAVLPVEIGEAIGTSLEVCDAVALGFGVGRRGHAARRDGVAIEAGRRVAVPQIALAASLGVTELIVRRRPVVTLVLAGPKPPAFEALCLAISVLVARDGGVVHCAPPHPDMARTLSCAEPADLFVVVGRSSWGEDDDAVHVIAAAGGRIDHHGLALTPGGSAGLGWLSGAPLLLLPGDPLSALVTYELVAGRLLRRLAGRAADFPCPVQRFVLSRKIASPVGVSEFVPVVRRGSSVEPLALAPADGLAGYARADGFLVVPAGLEGYAPGAIVEVVTMSGDIRRQEQS
jgi:molybdopterin molybdotransferase